MNEEIPICLDEIRRQGIEISIDHRTQKGPLLRVRGMFKTARALSNLPKLSKYSEVEIGFLKSPHKLYVSTSSLVSNPHVIVGYHVSGCPILIGVNRTLEAHMLIAGLTRAGKSTDQGLLIFQLSRLGFAVIIVGGKGWDASLAAGGFAGALSATRLAQGSAKPISTRFNCVSLQHGTSTMSFNYHLQKFGDIPNWQRANAIMQALGYGPEEDNPAQQFFINSATVALERAVSDVTSWQHLLGKLEKGVRNDQELYNIAGLLQKIRQLAAIEKLNVCSGDGAALDLWQVFENHEVVYFDSAFESVRAVGAAAAAMFLQAVIATKTAYNRSRDCKVFIVLDEVQNLHKCLVLSLIEQCASLSINLIYSIHGYEQIGEDWPIFGMCGVKLISSATPNSLMDQYLEAIAGTEDVLKLSCGIAESSAETNSISNSNSATNSTVTVGVSTSVNKGFSANLTTTKEPALDRNQRASLNYERSKFIFQASPGAEITCYGPLAILCERDTPYCTFSRINKLSEFVLKRGAQPQIAIIPQKLLPSTTTALDVASKRAQWLEILNKAAKTIRTSSNL